MSRTEGCDRNVASSNSTRKVGWMCNKRDPTTTGFPVGFLRGISRSSIETPLRIWSWWFLLQVDTETRWWPGRSSEFCRTDEDDDLFFFVVFKFLNGDLDNHLKKIKLLKDPTIGRELLAAVALRRQDMGGAISASACFVELIQLYLLYLFLFQSGIMIKKERLGGRNSELWKGIGGLGRGGWMLLFMENVKETVGDFGKETSLYLNEGNNLEN